jgi:hypothetical protein
MSSKDGNDGAGDAFSYHLVAPGQRNVRMGHYIVQEHIYDKLIQQLYVAGRSDFLHLNPTSEERIPFFTLVNYVSIGTVR